MFYSNNKLFAKYKDLNLNTQILKEYSSSVLEPPMNQNKRENEEANILFESTCLLQNKIYNQIQILFFDQK
jgi:hypothetical protein